MDLVKIDAKKRSEIGKTATKAVRKEGEVPCNLYGGNENISFSLDYNALKKGLYTDKFKVFELNMDGKAIKAIPKEVQFHPVTDKMIHVDFQELVSGKQVKTAIPIVTKGFAIGQKEGGKLELKLRKVNIKADADKIPSVIEIDVTPLDLGQSLRIRDIKEDGFEILNSKSIPIVTVIVPRALRGVKREAPVAAPMEALTEEIQVEEAEAAPPAGE